MSWEWREHDRAKVLACLQQGEYEAIVTSREGAMDTLAHLAAELGVLEAVTLLEVEREREGIPDELLLRTACVLPYYRSGRIERSHRKSVCRCLYLNADRLYSHRNTRGI